MPPALAVVAGIVGIIMAIKVVNKRRNTVSSDLHRFDTLEDGDGQRLRNPADAFELVAPAPQQQPVWGDVVQVSSSSNRIPSADKNF